MDINTFFRLIINNVAVIVAILAFALGFVFIAVERNETGRSS